MGPEDTAVLGTPRRKTFAVLEQVLQLIYDTPGIIPVEIGLETNHQSRIELNVLGLQSQWKDLGCSHQWDCVAEARSRSTDDAQRDQWG